MLNSTASLSGVFIAALLMMALLSGWYVYASRRWCLTCGGWGCEDRGKSSERPCRSCNGTGLLPQYRAHEADAHDVSPLVRSEHPNNFPRPRGVRNCTRCDGGGRVALGTITRDELIISNATRRHGDGPAQYLTCPVCYGWGRLPG